jgi:hypothetical protein
MGQSTRKFVRFQGHLDKGVPALRYIRPRLIGFTTVCCRHCRLCVLAGSPGVALAAETKRPDCAVGASADLGERQLLGLSLDLAAKNL